MSKTKKILINGAVMLLALLSGWSLAAFWLSYVHNLNTLSLLTIAFGLSSSVVLTGYLFSVLLTKMLKIFSKV